MTCCKKCYYRNKNSKYTNENCVFFDQSVEILDWVQLCLRRCFEDVASAQQLETLDPPYMKDLKAGINDTTHGNMSTLFGKK